MSQNQKFSHPKYEFSYSNPTRCQNPTHGPRAQKESLTIFVGGLSSKCQAPALRNYFDQFGWVVQCEPQTWKKNSSKCRGFAIMKCGDRETYDLILSQDKHNFEGRNIECKKYFSSKDKLHRHNKSVFERKILISGFNEDVTTADLEKYFSRFGELEIVYAVKSAKTNKSKGYGYVCFKDKKNRDWVLKKKGIRIGGLRVTCEPYQQKQVKELEKLLSQNKVENLLEIGCGDNQASSAKNISCKIKVEGSGLAEDKQEPRNLNGVGDSDVMLGENHHVKKEEPKPRAADLTTASSENVTQKGSTEGGSSNEEMPLLTKRTKRSLKSRRNYSLFGGFKNKNLARMFKNGLQSF